MKLDRNTNPDGDGKYALVKLRELSDKEKFTPEVYEAIDMLADLGIIDFGSTPETEFFVIRLKDKYAARALTAYALAAADEDGEYSSEIMALATKSSNYPNPRMPD